jgi:DNA polymerase IV
MDVSHPPAQRKIIHIDMDAFYAAVEQRDFPELRGKPVVVGGAPDSRGVVATCSYEARVFGIRSAMPASYARRLCPEVIFVKPRFDVYRSLSADIQAIFCEFTDQVEAISLDEAYLDVTDSPACQGSATLIAREIKRRILESTQLTASAGVSYNKFLAKIASDRHKPDGLCLILPSEALPLLHAMPIGAFHGIGQATAARMKTLGIQCGEDLSRVPREVLIEHFGKAGEHYYRIVRGIDERPVNPDRIRKSWGAETTFQTDLTDTRAMASHLSELARRVLTKMRAQRISATTITIKVKFDNFEQVTRCRTLGYPFTALCDVLPHLSQLLERTEAGPRKVRLLGVSFSGLEAITVRNKGQMDLFAPD